MERNGDQCEISQSLSPSPRDPRANALLGSDALQANTASSQQATTDHRPTRGCRHSPFLPERADGSSERARFSHDGVEQDVTNAPVQLQVENMSTISSRALLFSWYAVLLLAFVLQSFIGLQWEMRNICDADYVPYATLNNWSSGSCLEREVVWRKSGLGNSLRVHGAPSPQQRSGRVSHRFPMPMSASGRFLWLVPPVDDESLSSSLSLAPIGEAQTPSSVFGSSAGRVFTLRWVGSSFGSLLDRKLNRFVHVVLSVPSPMGNITPLEAQHRTYQLIVALEEVPPPAQMIDNSDESGGRSVPSQVGLLFSSSSEESGSQPPPLVYSYNATITCERNRQHCSTLILPSSVAVATNESFFTVTLFVVDEELSVTSTNASVGVIYQRATYTIATVGVRYTFLMYSVYRVLRFTARRRRSLFLYEQYWVALILLGLFCYLDAFFAVGVLTTKWRGVSNFIEFHVPNYFAALLVCFTFAVIMASIASSRANKLRRAAARRRFGCASPPYEQLSSQDGASSSVQLVQARTDERCTALWLSKQPVPRPATPILNEEAEPLLAGCTQPSSAIVSSAPCSSVHVFPPWWANLGLFLYFVCIVSLDIVKVFYEDWEWGTEVRCERPECRGLQYGMDGALLVGMAASCVALLWLHWNLGRSPYLETRPQQLAGRVFIFIFFTAFTYFIVQVVLVAVLYPHILGIISYQPLSQMSSIIVSTCFVNHMAYIYTCTQESALVPIRPSNSQWKRVPWSRDWYRWLNEHGGILYIFFSEEEEQYFEAVQCAGSQKKEPADRRDQRCPRSGRRREGSRVAAETHAPQPRRLSVPTCVSTPHGSATNSSATSYIHSTVSVDKGLDAKQHGSCTSHRLLPPRASSCLILSSNLVHPNDVTERDGACDRLRCHVEPTEETLTDRPLRTLLKRGTRNRAPFYFFNLETAMDCFNLSWEAYAVTESKGDQIVHTGFDVDEAPHAALNFIERVLMYLMRCVLCCVWYYHAEGQSVEAAEHISTTVAGVASSADLAAEDVVSVTVGSTSGVLTDGTPSVEALVPDASASTVAGVATGSAEANRTSPPSITQDVCAVGRRRRGVSPHFSDDGSREYSPGDPGCYLLVHPVMNPEQYGYRRIAVLDGHHVQVVITRLDQRASSSCKRRKPRIVIAFRGTDNAANALQNVRYRQRTWKEMETGALTARARVHSGFLEIWMFLKERIMEIVLGELRRDQLCYGKGPAQTAEAHVGIPTNLGWGQRGDRRITGIYVTGHSLGGALASLCAYSLHRALILVRYPNPHITVYTFGQPRIGNLTFQEIYNRAVPHTFRVVNESDAVSGWGIFGGRHVGVEVAIDRNGNYVCKPMYLERFFRPTRGHGLAVLNHSMVAYGHSLNMIAEQHARDQCPARCLQPRTPL